MATFARKCKRCDGEGTVELTGGRIADCFGCATTEGPTGHITVRTGADKAAHEDMRKFTTWLLPVLRRRATEMAGDDVAAHCHGSAAVKGFYALQRREPHRVAPLRASVEAGRLDDVVRALIAYA